VNDDGLVDVIVGYDCNLACDYCTITPAMRTRALATAQIVAELRRGRADGYHRAAFTGGEPTIRRDLLGLVRAARTLGYADIKVQTNGLVLGQGDNAARLAAAGATRIHVSIHTHVEAAYDELVRSPGSHGRMVAGLRAAVATGLPVVADLIVKADTVHRLRDAIHWLHVQGVRAADLWFLSLTDGARDQLAALPRMTAAAPAMAAAFAAGRALGMTVRSLHVPRCLLGEDHPHAYDPGARRVRVVTPDATFELRDSRLAGRVKVAACRGCRFEQICPGVRPDYLEVFGDEEIAAVRDRTSTVAPRRRLPVVGGASGPTR
jgi:cyclic pyranopterin phosphate synthase